MKEIAVEGDRRMTVREVAEALNVEERTVQRHAASLGLTSNGRTTYLDERAVTVIKQAIEKSGRNDLDNVVEVSKVTTALEISEMTIKVIQYHVAENERLRAELINAAPKLEAHAALMASEEDEPITKAMKSFGLHPRLHVFPFLVEKHYLTGTGDKYDPYLPSQKALDEDLMVKRETVCEDGKIRGQARIQKRQLDKWRVKMIPRIEEWLEDI